jgi:phosphate-selective porin
VSVDGTQWRLGLEAAWYDGPYMLQAEWIHIEEELSRMGAQSDVAHDGGYVMYQQVLSGATDISFAGVSPKSSVNPYGGGGSGALALALRLSVLESDDALQDLGFLQPGQFTPRVTSLSAGLNWYLSSHALLRTSFVHSI